MMERWIVADSILSIGGVGRKQKAGGGSNALLRQTSFLSSEAQWSQRAARQQGADSVEVGRGGGEFTGTSGDDGGGEGKATTSGSNERTRKRKRRGVSEDAPIGTGRFVSSRSVSTSGQSSRKRSRRHQSSSSPTDLFSDDSEGGGQDGDGEGADDDFRDDDDDDVECLL